MSDEIKCNDCGLRYEVTWHNDGMGPPISYCSRCGSDDLDDDDVDADEEEP